MAFKPPKNKILTENETIAQYKSWQTNILFHLSINNEWAAFIATDATWTKKSTANRGLVDDDNTVAANARKTAAQKNIQLEFMLQYIAQHAPVFVRGDIVKNSTSLNWIWRRIRRHYSFDQSEVNFLKLYTYI